MKRTAKTTAIGSLPHHNIDAALEASFKLDVPFLPQIPIRNPWEFMVAQALEGLPGLAVEKDGATVLDVDVWLGSAKVLDDRLRDAFSSMTNRREAFDAFEPSAATSSSWLPFLWELEERGVRLAKIQIAGPLTSQWALRLSDGTAVSKHPDLASQIYRLVLARALAMTRRLQAEGIQPILFIDEPGLYGLGQKDGPRAPALQELKLFVQAVRKERALVGMHCCSNAEWAAVLDVGLDYLSIDTHLSLEKLLRSQEALAGHVIGGGRLSLGVFPTSTASSRSANPRELFTELLDQFDRCWRGDPALSRRMIDEALYTPACGLALHSPADAELILSALADLGTYLRTGPGPLTTPEEAVAR